MPKRTPFGHDMDVIPTNSLQVLLFTQDLHKIMPVSISSWKREGLVRSQPS